MAARSCSGAWGTALTSEVSLVLNDFRVTFGHRDSTPTTWTRRRFLPPTATTTSLLPQVVVLFASAATVCEPPTQELITDIMRVNHDMRTPLACIHMATSLFLEDHAEQQNQQPLVGTPRLDPSACAAIREIAGRCQLLLGAAGARAAGYPPPGRANEMSAAVCTTTHKTTRGLLSQRSAAPGPTRTARAKTTLDLHKIESGEAVPALRPTDLRAAVLEAAQARTLLFRHMFFLSQRTPPLPAADA